MSLKKSFLIKAIPYLVLASLPAIGYGNYIKYFTNQSYIQQNYKIKSSESLTPRFSNGDITEKLCGDIKQDNKDIMCNIFETRKNEVVYRLLGSRTTQSITEIVEYDSKTTKPIRNIPIYKLNNINKDNSNQLKEIGFFSIGDSGKIDYIRELSEEEIY